MTSCAGHDVGRCTRIIVFISTTRAAILIRRRRKRVELGDAPHRALRRRDAKSPHHPIGAGMEKEPELVGGRLGAGRAVGGQMGLEGFDVVFRLAAPAVDVFVERAGVAPGQVGDDEARVRPLRADFDAGDDALDAAPALRAVVELLEPAQLALPAARPR